MPWKENVFVFCSNLQNSYQTLMLYKVPDQFDSPGCQEVFQQGHLSAHLLLLKVSYSAKPKTSGGIHSKKI